MANRDQHVDEGRSAPSDDRIAAALAAITTADDAIDAAKQRKRQQQEAFAAVLQDRLHDLAERDAIEEAAVLLGRLYWDERSVRVVDLQAASGLTGAELRRFVGPREVEVCCRSCGCVVTVEVRSRSGSTGAMCAACVGLASSRDVSAPSVPRADANDDLSDLFDFLTEVLGRRDCDNRLSLSRAWAAHVGRDPDVLARALQRRGGFCDCEVLYNVAPDPAVGPGPW